MGMAEYTQWCIKYPWHATKGMEVPEDCDCKYCKENIEIAEVSNEKSNG